MIYWIAKIYKNSTTQEYYYVIIGNQNEILFTSVKYQSISICKEAILSLQNNLKSNNLLFRINDVVNTKRFCFVVLERKESDSEQVILLGNSPSYANKQQCESALDVFKNIMCKSGKIIAPEAENANQNTIPRPSTDIHNNVSQNTNEENEVIPIDPRIMNYMFSLDGVGFDDKGNALSENPTEVKQWEHPESVFWANEVLREKYLKVVLKLGDNYEE